MTIYMSCFSCSKATKMVEDPLKSAAADNETVFIQDISGVVLDVNDEIKYGECTVRERSLTMVDEKVVQHVLSEMEDKKEIVEINIE